MLELKAKLYQRELSTQLHKLKNLVLLIFVTTFIAGYYRTTQQVYWKLHEVLQTFYNGEKSLFARLIACSGANPATIYQFYEFEYLDLVYLDSKLKELSHFPDEII